MTTDKTKQNKKLTAFQAHDPILVFINLKMKEKYIQELHVSVYYCGKKAVINLHSHAHFYSLSTRMGFFTQLILCAHVSVYYCGNRTQNSYQYTIKFGLKQLVAKATEIISIIETDRQRERESCLLYTSPSPRD
eukprot:TRINITY_DN5138_c0_g2_i7.p1 TRINITY_DN5138_c0_g2~~TRINITY_DN5138_c0_g2_i7.p1  ORF type:complete len:134 (-),score=2.53 TRINITY_DN5138_c0_g2_i7:10-411(-)